MLTEIKVPQQKEGVKESIPVVAARVLSKEQLQDVAIGVWKEAKNDSLSYDPFDAELSINDMAAVAIGMAMAKEYGEVFELPRVQFESLTWEYCDHLASEKLIRERR